MLECQTGDDPATTAWKAVMLPTYTTGTYLIFASNNKNAYQKTNCCRNGNNPN